MDFRELSYLVAIEEAGNITQAAKILFISQPSLSKFLSQTEQTLGVRLFVKEGRRCIPTYAGKCYLKMAREILALKASLDQEIEEIRNNESGVLTIGCPSVRASQLFPFLLSALKETLPGYKVQIVEKSSEELDKDLLSRKLDLAFYSMPVVSREGLSYQEICSERLLLTLPKGHPLMQQAVSLPDAPYPFLDLEACKEETLLLMERNQRTGQIVENYLLSRNLEFANVLRTRNMLTLMNLVSNGYGIGFFFDTHLQAFDMLDRLDCCTFTTPAFTGKFVAAYRSSEQLSPAAAHCLSMIQTQYGDYKHESN